MREGEIALVERYERVIEEYNYGNLNTSANYIIENEKQCEEKFEGKPKYMRKTPRASINKIKVVCQYSKNQILKNLYIDI